VIWEGGPAGATGKRPDSHTLYSANQYDFVSIAFPGHRAASRRQPGFGGSSS